MKCRPRSHRRGWGRCGLGCHADLILHSPDEAAILSPLAAALGQISVACGGSNGTAMTDATSEADKGTLRVDFDRRLMLQFRGSTITSDAGLLAYRELEDTFRLTDTGADTLGDVRTGRTAATGWRVCCANRCLASASPCWRQRGGYDRIPLQRASPRRNIGPTDRESGECRLRRLLDRRDPHGHKGRAADQIPPILD